MKREWYQYKAIALLLGILWIGSLAEAFAQEDFNPTPPPEPGQVLVQLVSNPRWEAYFEQTHSDGIYGVGSQVTVKAFPYADYEFESWLSADGVVLSKEPSYTFTVQKNCTLTAHLRYNPAGNPLEPGSRFYNVITEVTPYEGGSVSQSGYGIYQSGEAVTLTAHPYYEYQFSHWECDGERVSDNSVYTFTMPGKHLRVKAVFEWNPDSPIEPGAGYRLYLSSSDPEAGYASQSGNGIYHLGDEVTLIASPYPGYTFTGWYEGDECLGTSISYTLTITKRLTKIEARFRKNAPDEDDPIVDVKPDDGDDDEEEEEPDEETAHGQVQIEGLPIPGQKITITAIPDEGYAFEGWYLDGEFLPEAEMKHTLLVDYGMKKLVAKFRKLPIELHIDGGQKDWVQVTRYRGDVITLQAKEVTGHTFKGWYLVDRLLSQALRYDFNVNILRASLPAIRAVYVKGAVANEEVASLTSAVRVSFAAGRLQVVALSPVRQLQVVSFAGGLLGVTGVMSVAEQCSFSLPPVPVIIRVETTDGKRYIHKISPSR